MAVFGVFALAGPLLLLAAAVVSLWSRGPLGWLAAVALVLGVLWVCRLLWRITRRWWAGTKAPTSVRVTPAELRRRPPS